MVILRSYYSKLINKQFLTLISMFGNQNTNRRKRPRQWWSYL